MTLLDRWEVSLEENGYMYMDGWIPSLFTWNYHNTVKAAIAQYKLQSENNECLLLQAGLQGQRAQATGQLMHEFQAETIKIWTVWQEVWMTHLCIPDVNPVRLMSPLLASDISQLFLHNHALAHHQEMETKSGINPVIKATLKLPCWTL